MDTGLEFLLEMDGEVFPMDNGYWTKIEARIVVPNDKVPHGIRYSLTLHDRNNVRVLGYDNAHGLKPKKKKFGAKKTEWDHRHEKNRVESYEFENAAQLLVDFWNDVNRIMKEK
jgi:hypothetical protein